MLYRRRGRNRLIILISLAMCAAISIFHRAMLSARGFDPLQSSTRRFLLTPGLSAEDTVVHETEMTTFSLFAGSKLARENAALKIKVARLEIQNAGLREQSTENDRLRQMLDLPTRLSWNTRAADVLALRPSPMHDTALLLVKGSGDVHLRDVVIAGDGDLLGQVVQVTGQTADAMLLTDPLSSVGARVDAVGRPQSSKAVVGVCVGNRSRILKLIDLPGDADIEVGDHIVTSGLGGVYPPDIRIGSVIDVQVDTSRYLKAATVAPDADFNGIREVFLRQ